MHEPRNFCIQKLKLKNFSTERRKEKLSYWKTPGSEPIKSMTVPQLLSASKDSYGNREAISSFHQERALTFDQVYDQTQHLASGFLGIGLQKGDHVGILGLNTIEWYISFLAGISAGLVVVNLNPLLEAAEIKYSLQKTDVKALIIDESFNECHYYEIMLKILPELQQKSCNKPFQTNTLPALKYIITISDRSYPGTYVWKELLKWGSSNNSNKLQEVQESINEHDSCNIQFTSGTTASSKGALLSHHNIVNNSYFFSKRILLHQKHHKICLQVPLFHTFGTVIGVITSLHSGSTLVLPFYKFSAAKSIRAIIQEKCTVIYGTPTMYIDLITKANNLLKDDPIILSKLQTLEVAVVGGALCSPQLFKQMKNTFQLKRIHSVYGMTEASPITFSSLPTDSEFQITSTVGYVNEHTEVKVIDQKGDILPIGLPGEVCFKGYMVTKGYYNDDECTRQTIKNGWLHSGDRFILLENGYGQVIGRIKDTIIRGGENIEPSEIENFIVTHPEVINVQVYAVCDDRLGEAVAANIIKEKDSLLTEDEIRKYCEGNIARFKIPKYIKFVSSYSQTASGKVQKYKLRQQLEEELNLIRK